MNKSVAQHLFSFSSGFGGALALASSQNIDLYAALEHIHNGLREFAAAGSLLTPIAVGVIAAYKKRSSEESEGN